MVRRVLAALSRLPARVVGLLATRLPAAGSFPSPLHSEAVAARLGWWLGAAMLTCFATGLASHVAQHQPAWPRWPADPVDLYRVTQGLHVATGLVTVPLLAAKLWTVYPRLFARPAVRGARAARRAATLVLVGAALFEAVTGLLNVARVHPWRFSFPAAHHWMAWIAVGALSVHVGVTLPAAVGATRRRLDDAGTPGSLTRRGFLATVAAAGGAVTVSTVGQTVAPLAPVALLAPRRPDVGPQGLPVNRTAAQARVVALARHPGYRLHVVGARELVLSLAELRALPQHVVDLPVACVEGWSAAARWQGVRVADLLDAAGVPAGAWVRVESLQLAGPYRASVLGPPHSRDPRTLLALRLAGEPLHLDHGFPCRLVAPNRPGVLQTKWVCRIAVVR